MNLVRKLVCSWTFVIAAVVFGFGAVIAYVVTGDPYHAMVVKFAASALACLAAQFTYEEVAGWP